jgi:hypothetical protein
MGKCGLSQWWSKCVLAVSPAAHCSALLYSGLLHQSHNLYFLFTLQPFIPHSLLFLYHPEDGGSSFLQNIGNYWPKVVSNKVLTIINTCENLSSHSVLDGLASLQCLTVPLCEHSLWVWYFVVFSYKNALAAPLQPTVLCRIHRCRAVIVKYYTAMCKFSCT